MDRCRSICFFFCFALLSLLVAQVLARLPAAGPINEHAKYVLQAIASSNQLARATQPMDIAAGVAAVQEHVGAARGLLTQALPAAQEQLTLAGFCPPAGLVEKLAACEEAGFCPVDE